jgi:hypothetical protein
MVVVILDNAAYSSGGNAKPLGNNFLSISGGLGEDVLLGDVWNVVPVPHNLPVAWTAYCRGRRLGGEGETTGEG